MKDDSVYLSHILEAIGKIESYVSVGYSEFMAQSHWQDAVIRQLEIIGEAAKNLSEEIRSSDSSIPWRRICGLRDVLIHGYMGVDLNLVWEITQANVPELKQGVQQLLSEAGDP